MMSLILSAILSAAVKGTAILTFAFLLTLVLRKVSADVRHRIWLAALACLVLLMIPMRLPETAQVTFYYSADAVAQAADPRAVVAAARPAAAAQEARAVRARS